MKLSLHLNQLHYKVEVIVGVHLLDQEDDVGMFHAPQEWHLTLDHVLLCKKELESKEMVKIIHTHPYIIK